MWAGLLVLNAALAQAPEPVGVATAAELRAALASARPGARILVAPGSHGSVYAADVRGARDLPIVVVAADPADPPVFRGGVQLSRVAWIELRDLVIEGAPGNGLNVDDGGDPATPSHDLLLSGLRVRDIGGRGNHDGIKLSGVVDFRVEGCTVERWGRGGSAVDMVGCARGVIDGCTFRDREDDPAASGVQAKGGSREIHVLRSRFEHAGLRAVSLGGSTGLAFFRPPLGDGIAGAAGTGRAEARDLRVEGCTFVGSQAPIAFVGVDGAVVRWNTFHRPRKWVLRILQETVDERFVPCRGGVFQDNLIAWRADEVALAVNVGPGTAPETFELARNYWYCLDAPERARPSLVLPEQHGEGGRDPLFVDAEAGDFRVREESPARGHGAGARGGGG